MLDISIIFPAYNEVERIGPTLISFNDYLAKKGISYELIVVDDGSKDGTVNFVESLLDEIPNLTIVTSQKNKGKGHAIRKGMLCANGKIRIFSDADGSTPIEELEKIMEPIISGEFDIAIGSRYLENSKITQAQPFYRRIWSRFSNRVVQKLLLPGIIDPHCGFKAFRAESAMQLFSQCEINEWSFDLEVLSLARFSNFRIKEIPVKWENDARSKGRLSHLPREIFNVYRIRKRLRNKKMSSKNLAD